MSLGIERDIFLCKLLYNLQRYFPIYSTTRICLGFKYLVIIIAQLTKSYSLINLTELFAITNVREKHKYNL